MVLFCLLWSLSHCTYWSTGTPWVKIQTEEKKTIFLVDELDRCLPEYQIRVLENLYHLLSTAQVLHSLNPLQVESDVINDYNLEIGNFDITNVDKNLCNTIPSATEIGNVYARLIDSISDNYVDEISNVYNSEICKIIDNYNSSAYYEPSYVISRAYVNNGFWFLENGIDETY